MYERLLDPINRPLHSLIRRHYPASADARILDIGCGTGEQLAGYQGEDRTLAGIDLSRSMLERARRRLGPDVDLRLVSATELPFESGSFDQVLCSMALHEMPADSRIDVLRQVRMVLAPGGRLIVVDFAARPASMKGRLLRAVSWPIERIAGVDHFREFRDFVGTGGFPTLADHCDFQVESSRDVSGGNVGIYAASAAD